MSLLLLNSSARLRSALWICERSCIWGLAWGEVRVLSAQCPVSRERQQLLHPQKQCLPVGYSWPYDTSQLLLSKLPHRSTSASCSHSSTKTSINLFQIKLHMSVIISHNHKTKEISDLSWEPFIYILSWFLLHTQLIYVCDLFCCLNSIPLPQDSNMPIKCLTEHLR